LSSPPAFAVDPASITIHVDDDACPGSGGGTQADPFCSIQDALDVAFDGDDILVAPGTYNETINFLGKAVALRSTAGRDVTTIDAAGLDDTVVRCVSGEGPDTLLDGFTITNGRAVNGGFDNNGGGMRIETPNTLTSPTITRCRFSNNVAAANGGGLFAIGSKSIVSDTIFIDNMAMGEFNTGGGIQTNGAITIAHCFFIRNHASRMDEFGRGALGRNILSSVINCVFIANTSAGSAGATWRNSTSDLPFVNCVFIANAAAGQGDAIYVGGDSTETTPGLVNCIFWAHDGPPIEGPGTPSVTHSDVEGGYPGEGNINADPGFVRMPSAGPDGVWGTDDDDFGDLHLREDSPCIDAGDRAAPNLPATDLDGNPRVQGCFADMGAFEFPMPPPITDADTDCDDDVDTLDFALFASCFNKAGNPPRTLGCSPWAADQLDFDDDNDVDGVDFAQFAQCYNKADNPPRTLGCPHN
jgi:hypothetical protein